MGHTATLACVIIATIVWGLAFLPSLLNAFLSPMLFAAPDSEQDRRRWVVLCMRLALPALLLISLVGAWRAIADGHDATALWFCAAPLFLIVPMIIVAVFSIVPLLIFVCVR